MAQVGFNTKIEVKQGNGSFTELVDIVKLEKPTVKVKMASYQALRTTRYRRQFCGTDEVGDLKISMVHVAATFLTLVGYINDDTLTWRITRSDGTSTETFAGKILELGGPIEADQVDLTEITVAVDNSVTYA